MKKNLFILFSVYFFVVQALLAGILRSEPKFLWLGIINMIAILMLMLLYTDKDTQVAVHDKQKHIAHENKSHLRESISPLPKERKKTWELVFPSMLSFLTAGIMFGLFASHATSFTLLFLFSLSVGFIVFISLTLLFKYRIHKRFRSLLWTKIYVGVLVVALVFTGYEYYQTFTTHSISLPNYIASSLFWRTLPPSANTHLEETGEVLWSGLWATGLVETSISDVFTDVDTDTSSLETGTVLGSSEDIPTETTPVPSTKIGNQTLLDAVLYLLEKNNIPLSTKKDISFTHISFTNTNYAARRTAYDKKMIGKTTNPTKYIVCESYIVMKWLIENWNVQYTSSNVLQKFRAEATKRNALNGCTQGKIVTDATL